MLYEVKFEIQHFEVAASSSVSLFAFYYYDHKGNRKKKLVFNKQGNLASTSYIGIMIPQSSTSGKTLKGSGLSGFQKGNQPYEWNLWQASDRLRMVKLQISTQSYILKKSYCTPFGETAGIKASYSYNRNGESGLYYYRAWYYAA